MIGGVVVLVGMVLTLVAIGLPPNMYRQPFSSLLRLREFPKRKARLLLVAGALISIGSIVSSFEGRNSSSPEVKMKSQLDRGDAATRQMAPRHE